MNTLQLSVSYTDVSFAKFLQTIRRDLAEPCQRPDVEIISLSPLKDCVAVILKLFEQGLQSCDEWADL